MKHCEHCKSNFKTSIKIDGKWHNCSHRKFCFVCSPFGTKDKRSPEKRIADLDGCRTCSSCKKRLKLVDINFPKCKADKTGFKHECNPCCSLRTIKHQRAHKIKMLEYKGGKCESCGYSKCAASLHFHHKDPAIKSFSLAKYRTRSWESVKIELDKCLLLCANCHGEIHQI